MWKKGVEAVKEAGFRNTDISVLMPENVGTKDLAHEKNTKAPEGAPAGGGAGLVLDGTRGWLAGIGALAIPGPGTVHKSGTHCGDDGEWTKKAKSVLEPTGAQEISSTAESGADFAKSDRPLPRTGTGG